MSNSSSWSGAGGAPKINFGDALRYAWTRYKENLVPWLLMSVAFIACQWLGGADFRVFLAPQAYSLTQLSRVLLGILVSLIFTIATVNGALREVDGQKPTFGDFFNVKNWVQTFGTSVLVGVTVAVPIGAIVIAAAQLGLQTRVATNAAGSGLAAAGVLFLVALLLFIALTVLTYFAVWFTIDQRQNPFKAIKSSFSIARRNAKTVILMMLIVLGFQIVEGITLLVASLVLMPLTYIIGAYVFRSLALGPVTPVDPQQPPIGGYFPSGVPQGGGFTEPPYPSYPPMSDTPPPVGGFTEPPYPPAPKG